MLFSPENEAEGVKREQQYFDVMYFALVLTHLIVSSVHTIGAVITFNIK